MTSACAGRGSKFVEGLVSNLARRWGICGSVVRDKDGNYAIISFDVKTINKKFLPVPLWAYFFFSKVQAIVRLYDHWGPFTGRSFFFFYSEFKFPFVVVGTQSKAKTLPSKFDLFLGSHHGPELTQGDKEMEFLIHIAQCRFQVLLWHSIHC